jgi:hypothetical protein
VAAVVHGDADEVGVLLLGGGHDGLGGLAQAEVDDLGAGVSQHAGDDLQSPVVAVEAELGQHDAHRPPVGRLEPGHTAARSV